MRRIAIWLGVIFFAACSTAPKRVAEAPPSYQSTPQSTPVRMGIGQAPKLVEVQDAVKRVFKDAAVIDASYNPNFLAGDFNGDASQDIAVIIKPAKLDEMNQDLPPWLLREPRSNKPPTVRLRIEKDDVLLAVIHGYGPNDWRDPEATQTFVLKDVVGNDLKVHTGKEFVAANAGRKLPRAQGDLIGETLQGTQGYLYYAVSTYSWYDPKAFKDRQETPGVFHKSRTMR
jgi:hypothetical protein